MHPKIISENLPWFEFKFFHFRRGPFLIFQLLIILLNPNDYQDSPQPNLLHHDVYRSVISAPYRCY